MARAIPHNGDGCVTSMTLEVASEPKLRPQLKMRLTGDWLGFTVSVPWASGEPEALIPWIQKAAAIASTQDVAATLRTVSFAFSGYELSAANDSRIEELVQLWVVSFAAAGCWPELHEVARGRSAATNSKTGEVGFACGCSSSVQRVYEAAARVQSEAWIQSGARGGPLVANGGTPEGGVSERLYGHAQNSGGWLRALSAPGNAPPAASPTPVPKQSTPTLAPGKNQKIAAKQNEIKTLAGLVRKYIREFGSAPDFASDKPSAVEKAHNYIRSTTARPNLTEDELEQVRHTLKK